jgi:5-(carboxyamino)imidazole ribonucleotide mutase
MQMRNRESHDDSPQVLAVTVKTSLRMRRGFVYRFWPMAKPLVGIIMGSTSDWSTMEHAAQTLKALGIVAEHHVVSAHRTPDKMYDYAKSAESRGLKVIIAGAGGAAHLPGMTAALTPLPVLGVPVESQTLKGVDSLYSIVQMPGGIPVATFAIGKAGAINAALFAAAILATGGDKKIKKALDAFRANQTAKVIDAKLP